MKIKKENQIMKVKKRVLRSKDQEKQETLDGQFTVDTVKERDEKILLLEDLKINTKDRNQPRDPYQGNPHKIEMVIRRDNP